MTISNGRSYNRVMIAGVALVLALVTSFSGSSAVADMPTYAVGNSPVVNINIPNGNVTVRTWNRNEVQTDSTTALQVQQVGAQAVQHYLQRQINVFSPTVDTPHGPVTLPPETFELSSVNNDPHQGIIIKGNGGDTTVTIPESTAVVFARMPRGTVTMDGYRSGTFFVAVGYGAVHLENMGGDGFVQVLKGPIVAADSSFTRLRARTAAGGMIFERCNARQIEASSVTGTIVYDNGSFEPGLARFESQYGPVAVGVGSGSAQIGAHSNVGRVFTNFGRRTNVDARANQTTASVGNGGPAVNVSSGAGVFLYDGTIATRDTMRGAWGQFGAFMQRVHGRINALPASRPPEVNRSLQRNPNRRVPPSQQRRVRRPPPQV